MLSTALCTLVAPSPPLNARPGPNITHYISNEKISQNYYKGCNSDAK